MRIAWVGLGNNTHNHVIAAENLGFEHAAVVAPDGEERRHFVTAYDVPRSYDTLAELIAAGAVDAVCLDVPCAMRAGYAIACLDAGLPVLVEAPMASDADEARHLWDVAQRSGTPLMVSHGWRFDAEVRDLKQKMSRDALSSPSHSVVGSHTRAMFSAVDRARFLLDDPEPVSVFAHFGGDSGWDSGVIIITWDNGAASVIEARRQSVYQLYCLDEAYTAQLRHFAECVSQRVQPSVNGGHGYLGLCILDAAYASARIGKAIPL